jgi:RNase P/RNase MRP subunit p30
MPRRKPRGSRGFHSATADDPSHREAYDLMVMVPNYVSGIQSQLLVRKMMSRLASVGFTHMALTHTIYGRPRQKEDAADSAIPKSLWTTTAEESLAQEPNKKKRKKENSSTATSTDTPSIRVLRRLHAVLENLSDVAVFLSNGPFASLLNEYDIVSVSPRNEATFQSVCASPSVADIITLDYTTRGLRLPYRIRSADVKAAALRKIAFEIPYSPALLQNKQRKALVQACCELRTAAGSAPLLLFSSGDRTFEEKDLGTLALRTPGDLINLMQAVLQFEPTTSLNAIKKTGAGVLKKAEDRRWGGSDLVDIQIETEASLMHRPGEKQVPEGSNDKSTKLNPQAEIQCDDNDDEKGDDDDVQDGFIVM